MFIRRGAPQAVYLQLLKLFGGLGQPDGGKYKKIDTAGVKSAFPSNGDPVNAAATHHRWITQCHRGVANGTLARCFGCAATVYSWAKLRLAVRLAGQDILNLIISARYDLSLLGGFVKTI